MLNRFLIAFNILILSGLALIYDPAKAQAQGKRCNPAYESVTTLFYPDLGSYNLWESVHGEGPRQEVFRSLVPVSEGVTLAAGEMRPRPEMNASIMLAQFDYRGRAMWEKYHAVGGIKNVVKIKKFGEGYVVLANRHLPKQKKSFWIGFVDKEGTLGAHKVIRDKDRDLSANDMAVSRNNNEIVVAVTARRTLGDPQNPTIQKNAVVYTLGPKGGLKSSRAYVVGGDNEILGLSSAAAKQKGAQTEYLATGYFKNMQGKKMAVAMRLRSDGTIVWQQEFSRGMATQLKSAVLYQNDYILALGDVLPTNYGRVGGWLLLLDAYDGSIKWQRYFKGGSSDHDYFARNVMVNADNVISVMMMAQIEESEEKSGAKGTAALTPDDDLSGFEKELLPEDMSYIHVLTLNPRGEIMGGDAYFHGQLVHAHQMVEGLEGERLIAGYTDVPYNELIDQAYVPDDHTIPDTKINLPDSDSPQGSLTGLALLQKNMKQDKGAHGKEHGKDTEKQEEQEKQAITRNGWVIAGEAPKPYTDPCIIKPVELP